MAAWKSIAIFLLATGSIFGWSVFSDYENVLAREFGALEEQARLAVAQINGVLRGLDTAIQGLVADETSEPRIPSAIIAQRQLAFLSQFPEARTVFVANNTGKVLRAESIDGKGDLEKLLKFNVSQRDYFKYHQNIEGTDHNILYISQPFLAITNRQTVAVSRSIRGIHNEFLGVVVATLMPHVFDPVLRELLSKQILDAAAIHNRRGDILYRLPEADKYIGKNIGSGQAFQKYLQSDSAVTRYLGITATDNIKRVLVFGKIGNTGLDVGVSGQYDKIIAEWQHNSIIKALLFILFVTLSITLFKEFRRRQAIKETAQSYLDVAQVMLIAFDNIGNITLVNRKGCQLLGYEQQELLGMNWLQTCISPEEREFVSKLFDQIQTHLAMPGNIFENHVIRKDGERRLIAWHSSVIKDEFGKVIGTLNSGDDITEKRLAEIAVIAAKEAAESANEAKGRFLATISHEIRTPMTGIIGTAEFLEKTPLSDAQRTFLDTMLVSAKNLLNILNDVLDYSKIDALRLDITTKNFNIIELIDNVLRLFSPKAFQSRTKIILDTDTSQTLMVVGDPTRIKQVLGNLLSNAVKFTSNGTITIRFRHQVIDSRVQLRFEVSDTGIGISEQDIGQLFEPFAQAEPGRDRRFGGTGLGLAISKRLAELMGGEIGVNSQLAKGSTFWFTCLVDPGILEEEKSGLAETITAAPMIILLAEDNPINRMIIRVGLEQRHHQVTVVENGLQAYEAAARHRFDAIVMDMQMPVMDGAEATRQIRKLPKPFCDVPVVALTADALTEHRPAYMEAGLTDFVTKPIDWCELDAVLVKLHEMQASSPNAGEHPEQVGASIINLPLFDGRRLAQINEMMTRVDFENFIHELIDYCNNEHALLIAHINHGNINASRRLAHSLKGMLSNIGADKVSFIAEKIQNADHISECRIFISELSDTLIQTISHLKNQYNTETIIE